MNLESLKITNFRCFGPDAVTIRFEDDATVFIGANGVGKTAVMQALQRLFGIAADSRRVRRQDFHVPPTELLEPSERTFSIEAIFNFPELRGEEGDPKSIPAFWHQMAADENGTLKCRLRLDATWTNNGLDGSIDDRLTAIKSMEDSWAPEQEAKVLAHTRSQVQFVYVPASRDATAQVAALLRGRLWRAIKWSDEMLTELQGSGQQLNDTFQAEKGVGNFLGTLTNRWQEVHGGGTHSVPVLRPVNSRLDEFVKNVGVVFRPDETGRDRSVEELSDGQRSMFCISLVSATLDVENSVRDSVEGFDHDALSLPILTIVGVEEPENNLMPFYLSRIVQQLRDITSGGRIQATISSHSASVLSRIEPEQVRYFSKRSVAGSSIREIALPAGDEEHKYLREAVRAYPELYFASFVVLGEGSSEEVVLPRVAEALGLPIDRSFVAIVPLGGRHVNHLWRLLTDLRIPHLTLLDLDRGRHGGGQGRIGYVVDQLLEFGANPDLLFDDNEFTSAMAHDDSMSTEKISSWCMRLREHGVYFSAPLDIDMLMLLAAPEAYHATVEGQPSMRGNAASTVLGDRGNEEFAGALPYPWYRYLFLGRGKPTTHTKALANLTDEEIREKVPEVLRAIIEHIAFCLPARDTSGVVL